MAVDEDARGRGYGGRILKALEAQARRRKARKIVLNARENVVQFYARHGYAMTGQAETFFGVIRHWRMEKVLSARSIRLVSSAKRSKISNISSEAYILLS